MGSNLLWFVPSAILIAAGLVIPNAITGWSNITLGVHRGTLPALLLPCTYLCLSCIISSVILPLHYLGRIPAYFNPEHEDYGQRRAMVIILLLLAIVVAFVLPVLAWGTFPLPCDADNNIHLRIIPFCPWPGSIH